MGFFSDDENGGNADEFAKVEELAQETADKAPVQPQNQSNPEDAIPQEYRGKSVEEVIKMHQEAKKLIGRHSEEVGFAREMARKAAERMESLDKGSQTKRTDVDPEESDADFFARPKQTVEKAISEHPDVVAAREFSRQTSAERAFNKLKEKLGQDPTEVVNDPEFSAWMQENPFRQRALVHADQSHDPDAAYEVLRSFKRDKADRAAAANQTQTNIKDKVQTDKKAVMVDAGNVPGPDKGKVYRASDLRNLQRTNPALYEKMEDQILKAYAEKRVRFD